VPRLAQTCVRLDRPVFLVIFCITLTPQKLENKIKNKKKVISAIYSFFSKHATVNLQGRNVDHPPSHNAEVKNEGSYTSTPPIRLKAVDSENFTLPLPVPISGT